MPLIDLSLRWIPSSIPPPEPDARHRRPPIHALLRPSALKIAGDGAEERAGGLLLERRGVAGVDHDVDPVESFRQTSRSDQVHAVGPADRDKVVTASTYGIG